MKTSQLSSSPFTNENFAKWATEYMQCMAHEVESRESFRLANDLNVAAQKVGIPIIDVYWESFWAYNHKVNGNIDIHNESIHPFAPALAYIRDLHPRIVAMSKKNRKSRKRSSAEQSFFWWATQYLQRFFREVVHSENPNTWMWFELQTAADLAGSSNKFDYFNKYKHIPIHDIRVENRELVDFLPALRFIYKNGGSPKHLQHKRVVVSNKAEKSDLETAPEETINIVACPIELQGKIGSKDFEAKVLRIFTFALKHRGWRWLSSMQFADCLLIDQWEFEKWADNCSWLKPKTSNRGGFCYYTLRDNVMAENALKNTVDESEKAEVVPPSKDKGGPYAIGTDEFEAQATQLLSRDKLWRTVEALSKSLGQEPIAIQEWAESNNALVRKLSTKNKNTVYYALLSRISEKEIEKENEEDPKKRTPKRGPGFSIIQKDMLILGMLHSQGDALVRTMSHYANYLANRHDEAFSHFTKAQRSLNAGVAILQRSLKVPDDRLPPLEGI